MAQDHIRKEQYSKNGFFQIRDEGTQDWHVPTHYETFTPTKTNVVRPTFSPGTISITQQAVEPSFDASGILKSDLYMCKTTFLVTDLYDIRVKERAFPVSDHPKAHPQSRIEIHAVCKSPPVSHGLLATAGTSIDSVFKVAADTYESPASSVAIASLSDRWVSGDQEIFLSFTRSTAIDRKPGPKKAQINREPVTGPKVWVWSTFLAFLCGLEWAAPTLNIFNNAAKMSLTQIVDSKHTNPYAEFEKKGDDWVLIKINPNPKPRFAVVPGSSAAVAGPAAPRLTFPSHPPPMAASSAAVTGYPTTLPTCEPPTSVSSAVLASGWASNQPFRGADISESVKDGKKKATEEVEEGRQGKTAEIGGETEETKGVRQGEGVEIRNRSQLEQELGQVRTRACVYEQEEESFRRKKETEQAREKWLQQQLESLSIE